MFTLCIPTMDRFDTFLAKSLSKYLTYDLINEIVVTDENGADVKKINAAFQNAKLKLYVNDERLGPFSNKLKACSLASNEWIVLMDSDNFADEHYFETAKNYIVNHIGDQKNIILAPSFAKPNFNYTPYTGTIFKKGNLTSSGNSECLMNTGNYVINKFLTDGINLSNELDNIKHSSSLDVIYFNTLLFEQLDLNMHIVPNLEYEHVVHNGSFYLQTCNNFSNFHNYVHSRYRKLI